MKPSPLFIVAMPRSGTKLLRTLLNQHPDVDLCPHETHFIPYLVTTHTPPSSGEWAKDVYQDFCSTSFFWIMKNEGRVLPWERWDSLVQQAQGRWGRLLEGVLRFYGEKGTRDAKVWGDKTPGYLRHMPLLKRIFPGARFVHIYRDPRDYCVSVRRAWGKSTLRAAHRWKTEISTARQDAESLAGDYYEVSYEALVSRPSAVLGGLCDFLDIHFQPEMLQLDKSIEDLGLARGYVGIMASNAGGFRVILSQEEIKDIEGVVFPLLEPLGYEAEQADHPTRLGAIRLGLLQMYDGWASLSYHVRDKGLSRGLWYAYRHYTRSSWRHWSDDG